MDCPHDHRTGKVYLQTNDSYLKLDDDAGFYKFRDQLLKPLKVNVLEHYIDYNSLLVEASEEEVREAREHRRREKELDSRRCEAVTGSELLLDDRGGRFYRLDSESLSLFIEDAEKIAGLGEAIVAVYSFFEPYRRAELSIDMPIDILALVKHLRRLGIPHKPVRKKEPAPKMPKYLVCLQEGYLETLSRFYMILLKPSRELAKTVSKAKLLYEDGKLVLIDEEAVQELEKGEGGVS